MPRFKVLARSSLLPLLPAALLLYIAAGTMAAEDGHDYGTGASSPPTAEQFQGSIPREPVTAGVLTLSLHHAVELALANNLGLMLSREGINSSRGRRWIELSRLLPELRTGASVHRLQENLAITGITLPGVPSVVGPFSYYDARIFLSQRLLDIESIERSRAAAYDVADAELTERDARETVVVYVGGAYLQALAGLARVETLRAQVRTAKTLLDRAVELHKAGVYPGIDELRANVELLTRNQQLIVAENDLVKERLALARLVGLPVGQEIELTDKAPYEPLAAMDLKTMLAQAYRFRKDYRAAQARLGGAEASRQAAGAQRLPSLTLDADYGITGLNLSSMYDTYHIVGTINFPLLMGGRIHGDVLQADSLVRRREDELSDLRNRIEFEVHTAFLDVKAAAREVEVADKTAELAEMTLAQAQERFTAGVSDNLEVVQAQQAVAAAHESRISSLYMHNLAKLLLARAMGVAEERGVINSGGS